MKNGIWLSDFADDGMLTKHRDGCGDITAHIQVMDTVVDDEGIHVMVGFIDSHEGESPVTYDFPIDEEDYEKWQNAKHGELWIAQWVLDSMIEEAEEEALDMALSELI